MECSATVRNSQGRHEAAVATAGVSQAIAIGPKSTGPGSAASGGKLLLLALATCYCNDLYREAVELSESERAELAGLLLESLQTEPDPDVEAAWAEEIERRVRDIDEGRVQTIPWEQVRAELHARLAEKP